MNRRTIFIILLVLVVGTVIATMTCRPQQNKIEVIHYGISPFQDTAMPVVAEDMGLYKQNGLNVQLVSVGWEDIVPSLASAGQTIDVGIGSINLFLPRAENINIRGGGDVIFYCPLYVFKGGALLMRGNSGLTSMSDYLKRYPNDRDRAIREAMEQLRGKTIGVPQGTPYEQMLVAALKTAGMDPQKDVDIRYVKLAEALPAFLAEDIDIIGAGVTQRTEAMRQGHQVFLQMEDLGFAEIIGLVTTKHYAETHTQELDKLIQIWFKSVDTLMSDVDHNSKAVLDYLARNASTKYTLDEYKTALKFQEFPRSPKEANALMTNPSGRFYWKRTWDIVNVYLVDTGKSKAIPYEYYWGQRVSVLTQSPAP